MTVTVSPVSRAIVPERTFNGHLLFIALPEAPSAEWLARVQARFPGLRVLHYEIGWGEKLPADALSSKDRQNISLMTTSGGSIPETLDEMPKLVYVQLSTAGANDLLQKPIFKDTNISFCTANGVHGPQITEWVISTFLAFNHRIPQYIELQHKGIWKRYWTDTDDALGLRVGILGYGSIGRQTARVATALGMEVYAYTLHPRDTPESRRDNGYVPAGTGDPDGIFPSKWFSGGSRAELHAFLGSGLDLLVVATPLTSSTTHLLGAEEFMLLGRPQEGYNGGRRPGFLSNISRGAVVDTDALVVALNGGILRGAALDVTDPEPLPEGHALWTAKNVIVTPHISGISTKYCQRVMAIVEENLERLSDGRPLVNLVNRREGY